MPLGSVVQRGSIDARLDHGCGVGRPSDCAAARSERSADHIIARCGLEARTGPIRAMCDPGRRPLCRGQRTREAASAHRSDSGIGPAYRIRARSRAGGQGRDVSMRESQ
jgi:hypothetical protein